MATTEDAVKDLENEETDTIHAKVSLTLQNPKPSKNTLSTNENKALTNNNDTSIVILSADKSISTVSW